MYHWKKRKIFLMSICIGIFSFGQTAASRDHNHHLHDQEVDNTALQRPRMKFYAQASQDAFVYTLLYEILDKKDQGYYLEIGAGLPIDDNNSYFFEKNLAWYGVSIDILEGFKKQWHSMRKNPLLIEDALRLDYTALLQSFPPIIDYLSIDVDDHYDLVLEQIPFKDHIFKVITIEHDFYKYGDLYRNKERQILRSWGYHLLCSDISCVGLTFEDWWIHPRAFPPALFSALTALDLNAKDEKETMEIIQANLPQFKSHSSISIPK
jgi:hypothetical protein